MMRFEVRQKRTGDENSSAVVLIDESVKWVAHIAGIYTSGKFELSFINSFDNEFGYVDSLIGSHYAVICIGYHDGTREYLKWIEPMKYEPCTKEEAVEIVTKYRNYGGLIPSDNK